MPTDISASEEFHGLKARPFSLTPDLRFTYQSRSHTQALEQIGLALKRREGLVVVTGEIGTGKTMLCRALLDQFETRTFTSVILDPLLSVEDLLQQVLTDFGLISARDRNSTADPGPTLSRHEMVATLQQFLASLIPLQAHAVIMIDEAQHLTAPVLEQVRLLSNFETDSAKLLQIVLVGQPDLDVMLRRADMMQLNQRVARRAELSPLGADEVREYVERRLAVAGDDAAPAGGEDRFAELRKAEGIVTFAPEAIELVTTISQGVPRLVNTLCDRALEAAYERREHVVDRKAVLAAASRLRLAVPTGQGVSKNVRIAAAAVIVLALAALAWWWISAASSGAPSAAGRGADAPATAGTSATGAASAAPEPAPVTPGAAAPESPVSASAPGSVASGSVPPLAPAAATASGAPPSVTPQGVAPPAPAASTAPGAITPGAYEITAASFRTEERAVNVATTLRAAGMPVNSRVDASGQWYRVVVGPFVSMDDARAAQQQLEDRGFAGTRIYNTTPGAAPR